ncbi:MAG: hypothetical protein IT165_33195 [Bryobacterales bacterium]|nr:hypothetical protein [Bryobacterales bacterium]
MVLDPSGDTLYVSNWASESVSVIDARSNTVKSVIKVGRNPTWCSAKTAGYSWRVRTRTRCMWWIQSPCGPWR